MSGTMLVKLKEGLMHLRNPADNQLMKPGEDYLVPMNQFWLRRLQQGDVTLAGADPVEKSAPKAAAKSKAKEE